MQTAREDRIKAIFDEVGRGSNLDRALSLIANEIALDLGAPACKIWVVKRGDICERCPMAEGCTNRQMCMHLAAASGAQMNQEYPRIPLAVFNATMIARGGTGDFGDTNDAGEKLFGLQHIAHNQSQDSYALYPLRGASGTVGLVGVFKYRPFEQAELQRLAQLAPAATAAIRVAELQSRCDSLRTRLEKESAAIASVEEAAVKRETELEDGVAQLTRMVAQLKVERESLIVSTEEAARRAAQLEEENGELLKRADALEKAQQENSRASSEVASQFEADRRRVEEENEYLKNRLATLESSVSELNQLRETHDAEAILRSREAEEVRAELEAARGELQSAREEVSALQGRVIAVDEEAAQLRRHASALEQASAELLDQKTALESENAALRREKSEIVDSSNDLDRSLRIAEDARARLEQGRLAFEERISELSAEVDNLRLQNGRISGENEQLVTELERVRGEMAEIESSRSLTDDNEQLARLNSEMAEARSAAEARAAQLEAELAEAQSRAADLEQQHAEMAEANAQLDLAVKQFESLTARLEQSAMKFRDRAEASERARAELEHRNRMLVEQGRRLGLETQTKARFLANVSHELRTPMNAIIGFTSLLLEDRALQLSERHRLSLERVSRNARDLLELINDVLDLSKIEAGRMDVHSEPADARDLIETALAVVEPLRDGRPVRLGVEVEQDLPVLRTDRTKLQQVLINLLSNAIKFTREGEVKITASLAGPDSLLIAVSDTGSGIAETDLPKIFEEFRQVGPASRAQRSGTGLGLTITRRLVELLGGEINVTSRLGEGSVFEVTLPLEIQGRAGRGAGPDLPLTDPERTALVIGSDPASLYLTKKYLAEAGYSVVATDDAARGLEIARLAHPAIVTVDVDLFENGFVLIEQAARGERAGMVIAISNDQTAEQRAIDAGAATFLRKPVDRAALVAVLERVSAAAPSRVLVVDDNPDSLDLIVAMIADSGYEVQTALSGREALDEVARARPDLIILDLMLPDMDGFEIVHRLSLNAEWRSVPVILLTAGDLSPEERRALNIGTAHIIQKGNFSRDELLAQISLMIDKESAGRIALSA